MKTTTWRTALRDADAPDAMAKLVGLMLSTYMNAEGICWPGKPTLARACAVSKRAVDGAVDRLERAGYLVIERSAGGNPQACTNHYQATTPAVHDVQGLKTSAVQRVQGSKRSAVQMATLSRAADDTSPAPPAPELVEDEEQGAQERDPLSEGAACSPIKFDPKRVAEEAARL
jgi:hypothetical protein